MSTPSSPVDPVQEAYLRGVDDGQRSTIEVFIERMSQANIISVAEVCPKCGTKIVVCMEPPASAS